jgi:hypothetical protein
MTTNNELHQNCDMCPIAVECKNGFLRVKFGEQVEQSLPDFLQPQIAERKETMSAGKFTREVITIEDKKYGVFLSKLPDSEGTLQTTLNIRALNDSAKEQLATWEHTHLQQKTHREEHLTIPSPIRTISAPNYTTNNLRTPDYVSNSRQTRYETTPPAILTQTNNTEKNKPAPAATPEISVQRTVAETKPVHTPLAAPTQLSAHDSTPTLAVNENKEITMPDTASQITEQDIQVPVSSDSG